MTDQSALAHSPKAVAAFVMKAFPKPSPTCFDFYNNQSHFALLNMLEAMKFLGIPTKHSELYAATSKPSHFLDIYTQLSNLVSSKQCPDWIDPDSLCHIFAQWNRFVKKTNSGYDIDTDIFKRHYGAIAARLMQLNKKHFAQAGGV